jgi:hypothetical protein
LPEILRGSLKIGSYAEFRKLESGQLNDPDEGHNTVGIDALTALSEFHAESIIHSAIKTAPGVDPSTIVLEGLTIQHEFDFPTFCFSYENTWEVFSSLKDEKNQYDGVIEITDIRAVASIIAQGLSDLTGKYLSYIYLPVTYKAVVRQPNEPGPSNLQRAFEKPLAFSANKEGRLLFVIPDNPDGPTIGNWDGIFRSGKLSPYLRQVAFPKA